MEQFSWAQLGEMQPLVRIMDRLQFRSIFLGCLGQLRVKNFWFENI